MNAGASQSATANGHGNVVVQIVGDGNGVTIAGAVPLRLRAFQGADYTEAPIDPDNAGEAGFTATGREEVRILSAYNTASLQLRGRDALIDSLGAWLEAPAPVSVHALIGDGGCGKTRLAVQCAAWARDRGWTAGFARQDELRVFHRGGCRTTRSDPSLVILDYAAGKAAELAAWLRTLLDDPTDPPPQKLRILLLERRGPGSTWWRDLFEAPGAEGRAIARRLARGAPLQVDALPDAADRYGVFQDAFRQASTGVVPPRDAALDDALSRASLGGQPLFLAMFGLVSARQGLAVAKALSADRIALDLAGQELLRIRRVWTARKLPIVEDRPVPDHLAAIATLCEGLDEPAAHAAIARETAALNQAIAAGQTEPARAAMHAALPQEAGGIAAIQPDILGEAAIIRAFANLPDGGVDAIRRAAAGPARDAVTRTVIRACQDFLIRGQRAPLTWLQALRAEATDAESLLALANAMPRETIELREIAAEILGGAADLARQMKGEQGRALLIDALRAFSVRLSDLSRWEPALAAVEEAVAINWTLASGNPDAFAPSLANALLHLSERLSALGRHEAALNATESAVAICRNLTADPPDAFMLPLASALRFLAFRLSDLGRREAALEAIEEAVSNYRYFAEARPDVFLPDVALSLHDMSGCLFDLGRRESALAALEEAVAIRRTLAAARPDAFLPDLAISLNDLSVRLSDLGHREAALAAIEEAVGVFRPLAAARPDAFLPHFTATVHNLANRLSDLGRREAALAAIEEALATYRSLAAARPDAFLPDLAISLGARGRILREHDPANAAASFAESIATLRAPFLALPAAFASLMGNLEQEYLAACEAVGIDPDDALLAPIAEAFQRLSLTPPSPEP